MLGSRIPGAEHHTPTSEQRLDGGRGFTSWLERRDLAAQSRLGDEETLAGTPEVRFIGRGARHRHDDPT
jgi:hypothetical protein